MGCECVHEWPPSDGCEVLVCVCVCVCVHECVCVFINVCVYIHEDMKMLRQTVLVK